MAEKWDVSADGMTCTFHLQQGVKFHDRADLTADMVKKSIEWTAKTAGGASFNRAPVAGVAASDAATFVFALSPPQPLDRIAASGFAA